MTGGSRPAAPNADASRAILEARAIALARPAAVRSAGGTVELVTFGLANEVYGVESRCVLEVLKLGDVALLPGAIPPNWGVSVWRGGLLTVLDLRFVLGLVRTDLHDLSHLIVIGRERPVFGIVVDSVRELVRIAPGAIEVLPEGTTPRRRFLRGILGDATLVLDSDLLLHL